MSVRELKAKQRGPWCSYCIDLKRASYRGLGFSKFACTEHLQALREADARQEQRDSYETEGEYLARSQEPDQ